MDPIYNRNRKENKVFKMTVLCFSEWNIRLRLNIVSEGTMEYKSHSDCMPGKFLRGVTSVQYTNGIGNSVKKD